jgi:hypothetical protein
MLWTNIVPLIVNCINEFEFINNAVNTSSYMGNQKHKINTRSYPQNIGMVRLLVNNQNGKRVEGSGRDLAWGAIQTLSWRGWGKPRENWVQIFGMSRKWSTNFTHSRARPSPLPYLAIRTTWCKVLTFALPTGVRKILWIFWGHNF